MLVALLVLRSTVLLVNSIPICMHINAEISVVDGVCMCFVISLAGTAAS